MLREIEQAKQQASHAKFGIVFLKLVYFHSHVSHNFSYPKGRNKRDISYFHWPDLDLGP